jgi:hypothetical protein
MKTMIFKRRGWGMGMGNACGRLLVALTATLGLSATLGVTGSSAAGLVVPQAEKTTPAVPHTAAPPPAPAPAQSEPARPASSSSTVAPAPVEEVSAPAEHRVLQRRSRRHRRRGARRHRRGSLPSLIRLTEIAINDCEDWVICEGGSVAGGGGDGSWGTWGGEEGYGPWGGEDGSSDSGSSDSGADSGSSDSCSWDPLFCWGDDGSTDTGGSPDLGSPDTGGSLDTGGSSGSGDPCPWGGMCWDDPQPDPTSQPDPQPGPTSQPDLGLRPVSWPTADPVRSDPAPDDQGGGGTNCGIGFHLFGIHEAGAPDGLGPSTARIDCLGDPQLIPTCVNRRPDGACADGGPPLPSTLEAYVKAQDECIRAEESQEEAAVLDEIAAAFSADQVSRALLYVHQRNLGILSANQCNRIMQRF